MNVKGQAEEETLVDESPEKMFDNHELLSPSPDPSSDPFAVLVLVVCNGSVADF